MWCRNTFTGVNCFNRNDHCVSLASSNEQCETYCSSSAELELKGEGGRQERVKLQSVEALTMTDDQGLLQFLFYPFSVHESEITINVTNYEFQIAKDKLQGIKGPSGPMTDHARVLFLSFFQTIMDVF